MNELLIQCRERTGLSQNKYAEYLGISQSLLSLLEAGKRIPRFDTAKLIARKTGEKLDELFPEYNHN